MKGLPLSDLLVTGYIVLGFALSIFSTLLWKRSVLYHGVPLIYAPAGGAIVDHFLDRPFHWVQSLVVAALFYTFAWTYFLYDRWQRNRNEPPG